MLELEVLDKITGEIIWSVNVDYWPGGHVKYGQLPSNFSTYNGGVNSAVQEFPKEEDRTTPWAANLPKIQLVTP